MLNEIIIIIECYHYFILGKILLLCSVRLRRNLKTCKLQAGVAFDGIARTPMQTSVNIGRFVQG
jgi:hypothetical protein